MDENIFGAEKDSLVFLGLLARVSLAFDPPITVPTEPAPTHFYGLNIHAAVIDNGDGELLGVERNSIHADQSPVQHGEQWALRAAITRVLQKRPRPRSTTIEQYYRSQMFMSPGSQQADFLRGGATCYTTLEPCPMCASTLLVTRMKRVVFILADAKYGGAWLDLKAKFYAKDEADYKLMAIDPGISLFTAKCADLLARLRSKTDAMRAAGIRDTHLLDGCRSELDEAVELLRITTDGDLVTSGDDQSRNSQLLAMLKKSCNFPHP